MIAVVICFGLLVIGAAVLLSSNAKLRSDVETRIAAIEAKIKTKLP